MANSASTATPAHIARAKGATPAFCTLENRRYVLIAAILASALGFIDGTIISIALPAMRADLDASLIEAQWINNGYLLPLSALILLGGTLGDRYGTARAFAGGIALFMLASLLCAIAPNSETLIGFRVLKGIGAAVMIPGSLALIAKAYPRDARGRAIGIWAASAALTTALGPILGGLALEFGGPSVWRWLFAINLPIGAFALWLVLTRVAHDAARPDHPLDLPGAAIISMALALIAWGLTGTANWGLFSAGLALTLVFVVWEARSPSPMVPLSLFQNRGFAAANMATALIYFAFTAVVFFLPMTIIAGWGIPEALASVAFAPLSLLIGALSARAGALGDRYGAGRLIGAGGLTVAIAFALLALSVPMQVFWLSILPGTTLMGIGMALLVSPLSTAIMGAVPEENAGAASGINNAVTRVASLISVAVMGNLAGRIYAGAGGMGSFGAFSDAAGHADAMTAAFVSLAWISALLTGLGAALAWILIPKPEPKPVP